MSPSCAIDRLLANGSTSACHPMHPRKPGKGRLGDELRDSESTMKFIVVRMDAVQFMDCHTRHPYCHTTVQRIHRRLQLMKLPRGCSGGLQPSIPNPYQSYF
jgi:hypothetical protein